MIYRFDQFEVDETEFQLSSPSGVLSLEPKALRVLLYLVKNPNRLVRKQELLDSVWSDAFVSESTLTRTISLLRRALADDQREPKFIETVPTQGYRFKFPSRSSISRFRPTERFFPTLPKSWNRPRSPQQIESRLCHPLWLLRSELAFGIENGGLPWRAQFCSS
jgi:DNA-binding winged helix-turn-helix (wHTH) protein